MTVKLLDNETKALVDFEPGAVNAAVQSGRFGFPSDRGVPVRVEGKPAFVTPEYAAKYRDRLLFVSDQDVLRQRAEERFGGLGGAALGTAYGAVKGLSLGTIPAAAAALGADEFVRDIELAQPIPSAVGEFGSLLIDPFAVAGRALRLGRAAQEVRAGTEAAGAAVTRAAPAFAEATYEVERAVPALAAGPAAEAAPLRLGGRVAAAEPEAGAGFAAREAGRQPRALPPAGREPIAAPESPLTYQAPPFESQVMTDLRLGRANTADRMAELDQTIQLTLGSRARGARQSVRGLQEERAGLARQLEEYDFQLAKYEAPEAEALAAQAERAQEATKFRIEPTRAEAPQGVAGMTQQQLADYYGANGLPEGMDAYNALTARPSMRGLSQAEEARRFEEAGGVDAARSWADQMEGFWTRVSQQKPSGIRAAGSDSMWTNFVVGKDVKPAVGAAREKAYITLRDPLALSPVDMEQLLVALRKANYNGQVKVPGSGARLITKFDNIVMHGATKADVEVGERVARDLFSERVEATSFGRDVGGKSNTQVLAEALERGERGAVATEARPFVSPVTGTVGAAAPEVKLGERAAAEAEQARQRLRMGGGAPEFVGPEPGPLMRLGERPLAETPRVPGALEAEFTESALPAVLREAEMVAPAAAEAAPGLALSTPGPLAGLMAQGGTYGAAEEVRRQQTGESEGGLGAVVGAGLMGAAVPAALTLGGRALMGAGRAARGVVTAPAPGLVAKVKGGAESLEKTHVLRSFDISRDHVTRLNNKFDIPEAGEKGTSVFVNFIKNELNGVRNLKDAFPEDAILASIPEDKALKFSQLTPERKAALANAVERFYGQKYDTIFNDAVKSQMVDNALIEGVLRQVRAADVRGLEGLGLQSVKPELEAMEKFLREGQSHSVGSLKELQSLLGENFRARQGEGGSFTKAQSIMYGGLKRALYDAVERVTPGAVNELRATDMAYEMSKMLSEGAKKVVSKAATTSPIGRDLLAQAGLGVAIGQPLAALGYFIGASSLRYLYNQRGEGIIADLAGRLSTNLVRNPQVAARETVDSIVNASRPMLLGASATKFVDTKPDEYMAMSTAVRELQQTRDDVRRRIMDATATMSPDEQQKAVDYFDNQINVLAQRLPKGIPTGKALSEQEKQYSIFARSVLDPHGYGVQAIIGGGAGGQVAADAINSLGPQGQQFLTSLADDLQARISESAKLRGDENALAVLRNVKTSTRKGVGGGARLRAIHGSAMGQGVAAVGKAAPSAFANAAKAFSGTTAAIK